MVEAQQKIVAACKRHGVAAGIHNATAAYALKMIAAGYQFVTLASDSRLHQGKGEPPPIPRPGIPGHQGGRGAGDRAGRRRALAMPMWFLHDAAALTMISVADTQKVRNLQRDARVCVVAETGGGGDGSAA